MALLASTAAWVGNAIYLLVVMLQVHTKIAQNSHSLENNLCRIMPNHIMHYQAYKTQHVLNSLCGPPIHLNPHIHTQLFRDIQCTRTSTVHNSIPTKRMKYNITVVRARILVEEKVCQPAERTAERQMLTNRGRCSPTEADAHQNGS